MSFRPPEAQYPDGRFPPLALPPPNFQNAPNPPPAAPPVLHADEFENLKRSIQLLRISQLRYVVQKFSLPANGNKTRLLRIVLQLIDAMRGSPLLCQINAEVMSLLAQQHEPFTNPLESMHKMTLLRPDGGVPMPPCHPFIRYLNVVPVCGPMLAQPGSSLGNFSFATARTRGRFCLDFAWQKGEPTPFDMTAEINGLPISVCGDDPRPSPIDVTDFLQPQGQMNVIDFKLVKSQVPVVVCIREYEMLTLSSLIARIVGRANVDPRRDAIGARGPRCGHPQTFPLGPFLAQAIVSGRWQCPICGDRVGMEEIAVVSYVPAPDSATAKESDDWDHFMPAP